MCQSISPSVLAAFQTYELLQSIFRYLPLPEIVRNERVCRRWQAVITTSPQLQRKTYRSPIWQKAISPSNVEVDNTNAYAIYDRELAFNPALSALYDVPDWHLGCEYLARAVFHICSQHKSIGFSPKPTSQSFKRMFLTQPPCTIVMISVRGLKSCHNERESGKVDSAILDTHGVTLGSIMDESLALFESMGQRTETNDLFRVYLYVQMPVSKITKELWDAERSSLLCTNCERRDAWTKHKRSRRLQYDCNGRLERDFEH